MILVVILFSLTLKPWNVSDIPIDNSVPLTSISLSLCNTTHQSPCGRVISCAVSKNNTMWSSSRSEFHVKESEDIRLSTTLTKIQSDVSMEINMEVILNCSDEVGHPKFIEFKDKHLVLLWETVAACNMKYFDMYKNCMNHHMGEFNLQPLRHLLYYTTTNSKGYKYYVNVCGGTVGSVCGKFDNISACEIDLENKIKILGFASKQQIKDFHVEYKNKKNIVKIELICNSRVQQGELKFKNETGKTYIFELETPLVCIKELSDCSAEDGNNWRYNLSSLSNKDYEVYDQKNNKYLISVCGSVKHSSCPEGVSVCLANGNFSLNLGTLQNGPKVNEQLSISSSGGAYCIDNFRYKSVIIFKCAWSDSLPPLVNVSLHNCVYTFEWYTKYACPFSFAVGSDCKVRDPAYGIEFDLMPLHKPNKDYVINNDENGDQFHLNICGDLVAKCNGSTSVGVCLTDRRGEQHAIGEVAVSPHSKDGRLSFVLNGDLCKTNQMPSKVIIIFKCSHEATTEKSHPEFFSKNENCSYFFVWYTSIACAKFISHECSVSGESGEVYDLSSLSLDDDDYNVWHNTSDVHRKFIINVCQPIMLGHDARCLTDTQTGICMQDLMEPNYHKSFKSLGKASGLQFDKAKKVVKAEYTNGQFCPYGKGEYSSVIYFICDREEKAHSHPKFIEESNCQYEFEWKTKLVCSKEIKPEKDGIEDKNKNNKEVDCKAFIPYSGIRMDFSSFAGREYSVKSPTGELFRFTICGSLNNTSKPGVGICRETKNGCENMGMGNSHFHYNAGNVYLNYTDGVDCATNTMRHTVIEFICDTKYSGLLSVTSQNTCVYIVTWPTVLACMVPCVTDGPKQINLSFLSSNENNYKTTANGIDYFINVCKPLVPKQGLNCYHGSAVCKAVPQSENRWSEGISLGYPHFRPILLDNNVILNYSSYHQCPNNTFQNLTSSIIFICDPLIGVGVPVLNKMQSDCYYEFLWKTSVVCDDYTMSITDAISTRTLNNSQSNMYIDLQPLCNLAKNKVENYLIIMCDLHFLCEVQKIDPHRNISYGRVNNAVFSYSENVTKLFIFNGDECKAHSSEKYHASIVLLCTSNAVGHLYILKETDCSVEFEWKTSAACAHFAPSADVTAMAAKSSVGTIGVIAGILLAVIACLILYCVKKTTVSNCWRRNINRCLSRRHEGEFHYSLRNPDSYDFDASSEEML